MKLSFRVVLFLNILIASAVIIIANRVAIQIFLPLQIKEAINKRTYQLRRRVRSIFTR